MKAVVRKLCFFIIPVFFIVGLTGYFIVENKSGQRLSEEQIAEWRQEYPICGLHLPPLVDMGVPSFDQVKENADTFVYGTVTGEMSTYTEYISTGSSVLDTKRQNAGVSDAYTFYEYPISVIEDTAGLYKAGDCITIAANMVFVDYNPQLSEGMKVVVPVIQDSDKPGRTQFGVQGMYYVTEEDYVLSAFEESAMDMKPMSGMKVGELLKKLKK